MLYQANRSNREAAYGCVVQIDRQIQQRKVIALEIICAVSAIDEFAPVLFAPQLIANGGLQRCLLDNSLPKHLSRILAYHNHKVAN